MEVPSASITRHRAVMNDRSLILQQMDWLMAQRRLFAEKFDRASTLATLRRMVMRSAAGIPFPHTSATITAQLPSPHWK